MVAGKSPSTADYTLTHTVNGQTSYPVWASVIINPNSSSIGTWHDNLHTGTQTEFVSSSVPAITGAYANHGQYVSSSGGGVDAAHSLIGMPVLSQK